MAEKLMDQIKAVGADVAEENDADVFVYIGPLKSPHDDRFMSECGTPEEKRRENALLFLTTNGGEPNVAYRIARCLQRRYRKGQFSVFVDTRCKSSGTLLVLGAHRLIMSHRAQLGPLDIQILKPDELMEYSSGLTPLQALNTLQSRSYEFFEEYLLNLRFKYAMQITTRRAATLATNLTVGLLKPVYQQIDPMNLAENYRAMSISTHYGNRLETLGKNTKDNTIAKLLADYPSHDFVIDRTEARELFRQVEKPTENMVKLASLLDIPMPKSTDDPWIFWLNALNEGGDESDRQQEGTDKGDRSAEQEADERDSGENGSSRKGSTAAAKKPRAVRSG